MNKLREAVEHLLNTCPPIDASGEEAHARARAALAEPVADEPVAWRYRYKDRGNWLVISEKPAFLPAIGFECEPLYTRPAPAPAERGEYPPLPEPDHWMRNGYARFEPHHDAVACFTADQMRAYVDADRAQRAPLTDEQMLQCLRSIGLPIPMGLTRDVGPYEVTKPTYFLELFVRAIERAHGIGAKP